MGKRRKRSLLIGLLISAAGTIAIIKLPDEKIPEWLKRIRRIVRSAPHEEPSPPPAGDAAAHNPFTPNRPPWMEPVDGACPVTHPVKVNVTSGIYHVPGGRFYERTRPQRCYSDPAAAEADGYRAAKGS